MGERGGRERESEKGRKSEATREREKQRVTKEE